METPLPPRMSGGYVQHDGKEYKAVKEGLAYILSPPTQSAASEETKTDPTTCEATHVLAIKAYGEHLLSLKKQKAANRARKSAEAILTKGTKRKRDELYGEVQDSKSENDERLVPSPNQLDSRAYMEQNNSPSFTILDALSATGLRALRYASEIPFTTRIVANDLSPSAVQSMKMNIEYNGLGKLIEPNIGDARAYMYSRSNMHRAQSIGNSSSRFDVIDLDPYGSAAPFMDAALQGVKDGGLLCVTCTDAGVWASNGYPEKSFALYGGVPIKGSHSHEGGLRLILHGLAMSATKYGLAIEPLLSLSIDFYARVFVRVHRSPAEVKGLTGRGHPFITMGSLKVQLQGRNVSNADSGLT
ncbi:hypothetical protein EYZ11_003060 [Aspergillus tanneri]|uniref:tRNA (guanine(26)-N(2))-dimethyltransferase n=1 Tax=Aspergillus tanneri TaxID=1220188 RepID=A0A4S3JPD2_9EURO|nr:hypothetical protein EYZ11_003060 [Aspergillus tanneri]